MDNTTMLLILGGLIVLAVVAVWLANKK